MHASELSSSAAQFPTKTMMMLLLQSLLITLFVVNCQLMTRNCTSWLTGRFTSILIPVERNQKNECWFHYSQPPMRATEILYSLENDTPPQHKTTQSHLEN